MQIILIVVLTCLVHRVEGGRGRVIHDEAHDTVRLVDSNKKEYIEICMILPQLGVYLTILLSSDQKATFVHHQDEKNTHNHNQQCHYIITYYMSSYYELLC